MILLEAFRECAPLVSDSECDAVRSNAWTLLYEELKNLCRRVSGPREDLDDAVAIVAIRLQQSGPRGIRPGDPDSDARVRGYLVNALKNAVHDLRAPADQENIEADDRGVSRFRDLNSPDPEEEAMTAQRLREEEAARRKLFDEIVPAVAGDLRSDAGEEFVRSVDLLRLLCEGDVTPEMWLRERGETPDKVTLDAFYKRMSRARRRLAEGVDGHAAAGGYTAERTAALRAMVSRLRRK
jgi:DNA-directed RNA polymerase specialized sigma24 family protein